MTMPTYRSDIGRESMPLPSVSLTNVGEDPLVGVADVALSVE